MNPYALVIIAIGIVAVIVARKGTQDNVVSAFLGRPYGNSTLGAGNKLIA